MTARFGGFWSDDFDMDLLKVVPETRSILGAIADVKLVTQGHVTNGLLNHPSVWNAPGGSTAWFGFKDPARPKGWHSNEPLVHCTVLEALRDAWPHSYRVIIEGDLVWDFPIRTELFQALMFDRRGWKAERADVIEKILADLRASLNLAMARVDVLLMARAGAI